MVDFAGAFGKLATGGGARASLTSRYNPKKQFYAEPWAPSASLAFRYNPTKKFYAVPWAPSLLDIDVDKEIEMDTSIDM